MLSVLFQRQPNHSHSTLVPNQSTYEDKIESLSSEHGYVPKENLGVCIARPEEALPCVLS